MPKQRLKRKTTEAKKMQQLALLELAERSKHLISDWGCVCESCADWRAMPDPEGMLATVLTGLTGRAVQPFKMTQEEPTVEACLREFRCVSIALRHSQMEFTEFCSLRVC